MRNYEMMYILRPDLIDQEVKQIIDKYEDFIKEYGAEDIQITTLGKKRLAYPIKKHQTGIYIQMNYKALGAQVAPLERAMRISEEVLRYLTLCLDEEEIVEVDMRNTNAVVEPILPSNTGNSDGPRKTEPVTLKDDSSSSSDDNAAAASEEAATEGEDEPTPATEAAATTEEEAATEETVAVAE